MKTVPATSAQRQVRLQKGVIYRHTDAMPTDEAETLCKRLRNLANVLSPTVITTNCKKGFSRVQWRPASEQATGADLVAFVSPRIQRARQELRDSLSVCVQMDAELQTYLVQNGPTHDPDNEIGYVVDLANYECKCEDFYFRCQPISRRYSANVPCHHLLIVEMAIESGLMLTMEEAKIVQAAAKADRERKQADQAERARLREAMGIADTIGNTNEAKAARARELKKMQENW